MQGDIKMKVKTEMTGIGAKLKVSDGESNYTYHAKTLAFSYGNDEVEITVTGNDLFQFGIEILQHFLETGDRVYPDGTEERGTEIVDKMVAHAKAQAGIPTGS